MPENEVHHSEPRLSNASTEETTDNAPTDKTKLVNVAKASKKILTMTRSLKKLHENKKRRLTVLQTSEAYLAKKGWMSAMKQSFFEKTEERNLDQHEYRIRVFLTSLLIVCVAGTGATLAAMFSYWTYMVYFIGFGAGCFLFLFLDGYDNFAHFQKIFEKRSTALMVAFLILAVIDYILMGLEEDGLASGEGVTWVINILWWTCLPLLFSCFLAFWKTISFYGSESPVFHAFMYLTIVGYVFISMCRFIRPPSKDDTSSWHRYHDLNKILPSITFALSILFVFCVVLGGIGVASFAEFARTTSQNGVAIALVLFCIISMGIMLTPLAPGSIVDACGGFVFVQLFVEQEKWDFFAALGLAIGCIVLLHFCGACAQWWIGSWPCVQMWANATLPIEMLAASDAVLRDANFFKVGLVGYIFMDTANGLNQGRINMEFWTQLFSEWTSIPNALSLVSFGATIGAKALGVKGIDWSTVAVPLLAIAATLVQMMGGTFGAHAMGDSVDTVKYWTAREKWTMMQFFVRSGYSVTSTGWVNDVFCLAKVSFESFTSGPLFPRVDPLHQNYLAERNKVQDGDAKLIIFNRYREEIDAVREDHYANFQNCIDEALEKGWLMKQEKTEDVVGFFQQPDPSGRRMKFQMGLVAVQTVSFWASFYLIYWSTNLETAVQAGVQTLAVVAWYGWVAFCVFIISAMITYHVEILSSLKTMGGTIVWLVRCCQLPDDIETAFETPHYESTTLHSVVAE